MARYKPGIIPSLRCDTTHNQTGADGVAALATTRASIAVPNSATEVVVSLPTGTTTMVTVGSTSDADTGIVLYNAAGGVSTIHLGLAPDLTLLYYEAFASTGANSLALQFTWMYH